MKLFRVACWRRNDHDDDEPRVAVVAASSKEEAVEMCRARPGSDVYERFEVLGAVKPAEGAGAVPSGPARVLGFEGDHPGSWK